jgi:hypothetical protein
VACWGIWEQTSKSLALKIVVEGIALMMVEGCSRLTGSSMENENSPTPQV